MNGAVAMIPASHAATKSPRPNRVPYRSGCGYNDPMSKLRARKYSNADEARTTSASTIQKSPESEYFASGKPLRTAWVDQKMKRPKQIAETIAASWIERVDLRKALPACSSRCHSQAERYRGRAPRQAEIRHETARQPALSLVSR